MEKITLTLAGVDYVGIPLTLDGLRALRKCDAGSFDLDVLTIWLSDEDTAPKTTKPGRIAASKGEIEAAVKVILAASGFTVGEAQAEVA